MQRFNFRLTLVLILVLAALVLAGCGGDSKKDEPATFSTLNAQQAFDRFSKNGSAVIVDVRNPDEWAATGVPAGAALIPLPEFEQRAPGELPKDKEIYVICNSGNRSVVAAQFLIESSYTEVVNIDGGFQAWMRAGLPAEPYTP